MSNEEMNSEQTEDVSAEVSATTFGEADPVPVLSDLDLKINQFFAGSVVRKDLVKAVKGNAIVPSYVLEYLLAQYCASDDPSTISAGIERVKAILKDHYVHRNEAGLIRSRIRDKGSYKVIDKVSVSLNDKDDVHEAEFANLGIKGLAVSDNIVKAHPKLLVGGVWCLCDVEYSHSENPKIVPWQLGSLKPIQLSGFDEDQFLEARKNFQTDDWIDLLMQSIGFNPEKFGKRAKLLQMVRLIPFVERNYNLVELGPKGTGKSHIYSEFSPHGMLISGGEVSVPKLFVNNSNGRLGLVGYWDVVAFDEFAGRKKKTDKALVDIMKNYMANKTFSRGVETLGAEASMVFVGNTSHNVAYMLKHSDLFEELPESYHDSAFLDRLHFYIPGWEVDVIRSEMFSSGFGFVVDYIAEVLKSLRAQDFSDSYKQHGLELSNSISTRDRDAIHKTYSGLLKVIFPNRDESPEEAEQLLKFAIEGRKRVKDQIVRIDKTMGAVEFSYTNSSGETVVVETLEEIEFPALYAAQSDFIQVTPSLTSPENNARAANESSVNIVLDTAVSSNPELFIGHKEFQENQRGLSYSDLFIPYLKDAKQITITDPYIRKFHQARNLMEFVEALARVKSIADEVVIKLRTSRSTDGDESLLKQVSLLANVEEGAALAGITFDYEFDDTLHDRSIETDTGWKIALGRGLDIFQNVSGDAFDLANRLQEYRQVKAFSITYIRNE